MCFVELEGHGHHYLYCRYIFEMAINITEVVISGPTNAIKRKRLLIFQMFLSLSILFFSITACFCCQRALCFARQSVLCQCGLLCVMQEGRNLGAPCVLLRSDQCRLPQTSAVCCGDSPSLCFDV